MQIQENVSLKSYTRMRSGGEARFFVSVSTLPELKDSLAWARERSLPVAILGGGSNTLVPDQGFSGLVVHIAIMERGFRVTPGGVEVVLGAGEVWDAVVGDVVARGLWGVENLSLIPGTVGGAVVQNIGAYGVELKDVVLWVEAYNIEADRVERFDQPLCAFAYRSSYFKTRPRYIVLRVALVLSSAPHPQIDYEDVRKYFDTNGGDRSTLASIRDAIIAIRTAKLPGFEVGTLGSYFKNPIIDKALVENLKTRFPGIKTYPALSNSAKISAAWLIDHVAHLRGVRRGNAGVHSRQALVLVNYGGATTNEIIALAQEIKNSIKEKTSIILEEEVETMKNIF